jgi:hypothetical protein
MQLNLAFLDRPDLPPIPFPAAPSATTWEQLDEASRISGGPFPFRRIDRSQQVRAP